MEAIVARTATWVTATCTDEVFELMRMGRPRARISIVPCGVNLDLFTPVGTQAPRAAQHRIVSVGRFVPRKGFDVVIRALPLMPNTELIIVGGPDRSQFDSDPEVCRLRDLAAELSVGDRVRLHGSVAREGHACAAAVGRRGGLHPWYEPFGIVPLEAMACGIPVVASAVGGMLDTVLDDVTGRLVPPKRPAETADAIYPLLRDAFLRRSLGAAGRDRARSRYSWDRIAGDTLRIYDRMVPAGYSRPTAATSGAHQESSSQNATNGVRQAATPTLRPTAPRLEFSSMTCSRFAARASMRCTLPTESSLELLSTRMIGQFVVSSSRVMVVASSAARLRLAITHEVLAGWAAAVTVRATRCGAA
jgi:D-inositol-3-phosphate glycosyltransferase